MAHVKRSAAKRRRAIAFAAVAVAFLTTSTYWLAAAGSSAPTISAPVGVSADGEVAEVVTMISTVTRSNGSASLESGKTIAKLKIAKDYTNKIRVSIVWTNPVDAAKVLNSPNAQITMGLYRPVSTTGGGCSTADAVAVTDSGTTFCTVLDTAATGSGSVSSGGALLLAKELLAGYLNPSISAAASLSSCLPDTDAPTAWCQPNNVTADQRLLYVIAAITVPGGIPVGQVNTTGNLKFYVQAFRTTAA